MGDILDVRDRLLTEARERDPESENILKEFCEARGVSMEELGEFTSEQSAEVLSRIAEVIAATGALDAHVLFPLVVVGFQVGFEMAASKYAGDPRKD